MHLLHKNQAETVDSSNPKKIKVLIVSPCQGIYGGMEAFVLTLAQSLIQNPALEVRLCFKRVKGFALQDNLQIMCQKSQVPFSFVNKGSITLIQEIAWADIVHGQNTSPDVVLLARLLGKRVVLTIHNYWCKRGWGIYSAIWKVVANFAHLRLYNSNFVWQTWEPHLKSHKSSRVPTVSQLPEGRLAINQRNGFVFLARWIQNKGIEVLVKAYAQAKLDRRKWSLKLMGDGPLRADIEKYIQQQKIDGIEILGFVNDEKKAEVIRSSRWIVIPPHTKEDFGLTALEARNVGVPCIITRDGGLPEAAGNYSLSCEPDNVEQLARLLEVAANMSDDDYKTLANASYHELQAYLKPISFYVEKYKSLLA
ncbi:glycosyl transferase group 1 [Gloeocapsa sp. PCC 7428]|uniref:glycosyltransferase family 4 protein n=1 Tax=Gloeocapsa sp. PCC 7428 TaxID=1173026 RepID=UPI0002A5C869|nr:glycosyltransferase family 4 protein [Gloeocapsa sp. PCC 7428]AFZ32160.1 glycosyl transferase group 1 [Gloeocapsa sp. PCC 7428]